MGISSSGNIRFLYRSPGRKLRAFPATQAKNNGNKATRQKAWERCPCRTSQAAETSSSRPEHSKDARKETEPPFFSTFCRISGMIILMVPCRRPRRIAPAQDPAGTATSSNAGSSESGKDNASPTGRGHARKGNAPGMNNRTSPGSDESFPATGRSSAFTGTFPAFIRHRGMFFDQRAHNMLRHHPGRRIP